MMLLAAPTLVDTPATLSVVAESGASAGHVGRPAPTVAPPSPRLAWDDEDEDDDFFDAGDDDDDLDDDEDDDFFDDEDDDEEDDDEFVDDDEDEEDDDDLKDVVSVDIAGFRRPCSAGAADRLALVVCT